MHRVEYRVAGVIWPTEDHSVPATDLNLEHETSVKTPKIAWAPCLGTDPKEIPKMQIADFPEELKRFHHVRTDEVMRSKPADVCAGQRGCSVQAARAVTLGRA